MSATPTSIMRTVAYLRKRLSRIVRGADCSAPKRSVSIIAYNDLVGSLDERWRDCDTQLLRLRQVDGEREGFGTLDRDFRRAHPLQHEHHHLGDEARALLERKRLLIRNEAAELHELCRRIRDGLTQRFQHVDDGGRVVERQDGVRNVPGIDALRARRAKGLRQIARRLGQEDMRVEALTPGDLQNASPIRFVDPPAVDKYAKLPGARRYLSQELQPLLIDGDKIGEAGDVAAWTS